MLLTGAWEAIKKELEAIRRITQTEALFHSGELLLNLKEANVSRQWRELGDEGEFCSFTYTHIHTFTYIQIYLFCFQSFPIFSANIFLNGASQQQTKRILDFSMLYASTITCSNPPFLLIFLRQNQHNESSGEEEKNLLTSVPPPHSCQIHWP